MHTIGGSFFEYLVFGFQFVARRVPLKLVTLVLGVSKKVVVSALQMRLLAKIGVNGSLVISLNHECQFVDST